MTLFQQYLMSDKTMEQHVASTMGPGNWTYAPICIGFSVLHVFGISLQFCYFPTYGGRSREETLIFRTPSKNLAWF